MNRIPACSLEYVWINLRLDVVADTWYNSDCRKPCEPATAVQSKMSTELVHRHARRTRRKPNTKLGMSKPRCHAFTLTFHCVRRGDLLCKCSTGNAASRERKMVRGERLGGGQILLELKTSTLELLRFELHNKIRGGESEPGAAWRIHPHFSLWNAGVRVVKTRRWVSRCCYGRRRAMLVCFLML
jgi:hypothetical protein